jgi:hypothetical protein
MERDLHIFRHRHPLRRTIVLHLQEINPAHAALFEVITGKLFRAIEAKPGLTPTGHLFWCEASEPG